VALTSLSWVPTHTLVAAVLPVVAAATIVSQVPFRVSASPVGLALFSPWAVPTTRSPATSAVPVVVADGEPDVLVPDATVFRRVSWTPPKPSMTATLATTADPKVMVVIVAPDAIEEVVLVVKTAPQMPDPAVVVTPDPVVVPR
jgi:hypothetical protein